MDADPSTLPIVLEIIARESSKLGTSEPSPSPNPTEQTPIPTTLEGRIDAFMEGRISPAKVFGYALGDTRQDYRSTDDYDPSYHGIILGTRNVEEKLLVLIGFKDKDGNPFYTAFDPLELSDDGAVFKIAGSYSSASDNLEERRLDQREQEKILNENLFEGVVFTNLILGTNRIDQQRATAENLYDFMHKATYETAYMNLEVPPTVNSIPESYDPRKIPTITEITIVP